MNRAAAYKRDAASDARADCDLLNAVEVARTIGLFAGDPADSRYQRAYLKELWVILRERMPK